MKLFKKILLALLAILLLGLGAYLRLNYGNRNPKLDDSKESI